MAGPNNPYAAAAERLATDIRSASDAPTAPIAPVVSADTAPDMGAVRMAPQVSLTGPSNPYMAAAQALSAQPAPPAPIADPTAGPALNTPPTPITSQVPDPAVQQDAAASAAAADAFLNSGVRANVVAEIRRIARDEGLPLPLAAQTYMEQARNRPGTAYRRLLQQNPGLREIARQGSAYADFMEDAAELATVENAFNTVRSTVIGAARFPTVSIPRGLAELNDVTARAIANALRDILPDAVTSALDEAGADFVALQEQLGIPLTPFGALRAPADVLDEVYRAIDTPPEAQTFTTDVGAALGQFGAQAALYLLTGGQAAILTNFFAIIDEQSQRVEQAGAYGTIEGDIGTIGAAGVGALLDQLNLGLIFERIPEGMRNRVFRSLASGTTEGVTELLQAISSNLVAQQIYDPTSGLLDDAAYEGLLGGIVGAFAGALIPGRQRGPRLEDLPPEVSALLDPGGLESAAQQAETAQEALEVTRAAIEETQTFVRDPEAVRELLEASGDQDVTIPVQEVERLYQEGVLTDDDIAYLQVEDDLTQQGELSGDVRTTASRVLTLQGDKFSSLVEHVRTQPGAPTVAEARADLANREADITRLQGILEQAQAVAGEVNTLADTIMEQLRATTRLSRGQARAAGRLLAERYAARAALFEPGTTAQSLYERDLVTFETEARVPAPPTAPIIDPQILDTVDAALADVAADQPVQLPDSPELIAAMTEAGIPVVDGTLEPAAFDAARALLPTLRAGVPPLEQPAADIGNARQRLADDPASLGLDPELAASINPIYRPEALPPGRMKGSNQEAAQFLEDTYADEPITDLTAEITPERLDRIATQMAAETELALESSGNAADWYSAALERTLSVAAVKYPMLTSDAAAEAAGLGTASNARFLFTYIMATTSQNLDVAANAKATDAAFEQMLARWAAGDYTMDTKRWGTGDKKKAMNENFAKFNRMLPKMPGDTAVERLSSMDRLFRQSNTVGEWTRLMDAAGIPYTPPGQTAVDAVVYGSSTLGPKIGNGFWQNLNGNFSPLTIDLWMRRTWGRLTGKSIGLEDALPGQRSRLKAAVDRSRSRRNDVDAYVSELQAQLDAVTTTLDALTINDFGTKKAFNAETRRLRAEAANLREVIADAKGVQAPEPYKAAYDTDNAALLTYAKRLLKVWDTEYKRLVAQYGADAIPDDLQPTWARAAKTIRANLGTPLDQVANGTQRRQIETAGQLAIQKLAARGINVTMADMQALLWYPEKELWASLTRKLDVDEDGVPIPITSNLNESYDAVFTRILGEQGYEVQRGTGDGAGTARDRAVFEQPDITGERDQGADGEVVRADQRGRGTGGYSSGGLAPLEGAPNVVGAAGPDAELVAVAERYAAANGIELRRQAEFVEVDPERAARIAQAYEEMEHSPQDPVVLEAYQNLIAQTVAQYDALVEAGYEFYFFDENSDPYDGNPWNAMRDLRANKRMGVFSTEAGFGSGATDLNVDDNPMLAETGIMWAYGSPDGPTQRVLANDLFRAVHDAFGHGIEGAGFRARGEENAWQAHVRLFTGSAVAAITSETRGQNSWLNYGPFGEQNRTASVEDTVFADQKTGLMPAFTWEEGRAADQPAPAPAPVVLEQPTQGPQTQNQGEVGAPRGSYTLPTSDDPRNLITLSANADPSTFVHEVGHMFLFQMTRDLADPRLTEAGREQLTQQIDATRAWFASNSEQAFGELKKLAKDAERRAARLAAGPEKVAATTRASRLRAAADRAQAGGGAAYMQTVASSFMDPTAQGYDEAAEVVFHEQWARGFEVYLGTGDAPSAQLRSAFAKFSQYITAVYKSLRRLNVRVTPEIADVFDRLVATEDAILEERRGAMYQISPGVLDGATPAEANELRRLAAEAETQARTEMAARAENSLKREATAARRARREVLANRISEEVAAEPVYAATNIAKRGVMPDGTVTGTGKIDRAEFVAVFDEATLARMPSGMVSGKVRPANAIPLGDLATLSGFPDIYSMVEALTNPTPQPEAAAVRSRTDAAMREEFGADFDPEVLKAKSVEVAQNDKFQQLQQLQLRILRRLAAEPMARIARRQAEQLGAPAAAVDQAATEAAQAEQARARTPREGVQASLARIKADVQKTANASQRRAQTAARRQTAAIRLGMDPAAITEAAKRYVEKLKVKDATPDRYRQAAARLTAKIERAIAGRDYAEAALLMEQRALNLAVAKEAGAVQARVEQRRTRWREVTSRSDKRLAQSYSLDWVNAIRVALEPFGLARNTPRNYDPAKALANIQAVEPTLFAEIQLAMAGYAARAQAAQQANPNNPYKDLTVAEINELFEQADRMLGNARDSKGLLVDGRRVAFEAIADEVAVNVSKRKKVQRQARAADRGRGSSRFRETRRQLGAFKASLRRIELWARDFDNGNPRGPLTRYLVRPVMAAIDAYTVARRGPQEALAALLRGRTDLMRVKPIRATELDGYVFRTKGELIMALLHTGNASNKRKLLLGGATDVETNRRYVWGTQDAEGNLHTARWDRFVARMFAEGTLTKADMDLVQGIWDIFEATKPAAQAAHKQMYGYYFTEVVAEEVDTPVGTYPGGYAPAITDTMMNPDGDRFEAEEVMSQQSNAAMFPGAEKGFTQSRTEYNQPLDLDLTRIPAHFDRVMKFAYLGPAVRNAARLVTNPAFREAVRPGSPDVLDVAVIPWLQRTVQQRVSTAPTSRGWSGVSKVAQIVDRRVGLHIMAANMVNAAQQFTGFSVAAARIPVRHIAAAATRWRVGTQSARAYIMSQSTFMQERMTGGMNEASTTLDKILREPGVLNNLQAASMRYGYFAQQIAQNLIDPTVWLAAERHGMQIVYPVAYAEALERTGDEAASDAAARAEVVAYADSVVRDTQSPMQASDVSGIEASSPLARLFLKFYSYFNSMGNLLVTEVNIAQNSEMGWAGRYGRSFYAYLMIVTIPSIVAEGIAQLARGGLDDLEDEDERDQIMFELLIGSQLKTMAAMVPFAGAVASTAYGIAVTKEVYDDRISLSAGIGVTESTLQDTIRLIYALADPDTDIETRRAIRTTLNALGLILGLPTNWVSKPASYAASVIEGDSDPQGMADILQGILTGRDGTDR
jgi:hypothetical protein